MTEVAVNIPKETEVDPIETERTRLAELLFKLAPHLTAEYRILIQHTGGFLTSSMCYAYSKGLQDAIKLLLKENKK